jgi:hypothetical protein
VINSSIHAATLNWHCAKHFPNHAHVVVRRHCCPNLVNSPTSRRNRLIFILEILDKLLEINRKISVAPMMDWIDEEEIAC